MTQHKPSYRIKWRDHHMTWHTDIKASKHFTSKHKTSRPWNGRRLVHNAFGRESWSVALRTFYRQILSLLYSSFPCGNLSPGLSGHYWYETIRCPYSEHILHESTKKASPYKPTSNMQGSWNRPSNRDGGHAVAKLSTKQKLWSLGLNMDACVYLKESTRQRALPTCCFQDISTRLLAGRVYLSALSLHIRSTDVPLQRKKKKEKNERMRLSTALGISSPGQVVCWWPLLIFHIFHTAPWQPLELSEELVTKGEAVWTLCVFDVGPQKIRNSSKIVLWPSPWKGHLQPQPPAKRHLEKPQMKMHQLRPGRP